jgi:beta-lactam-binding protein with PASTA domain
MYDPEFANKLIGTLALFVALFCIFVFAIVGCIIFTSWIFQGGRKDIPPVLNKSGVKME